MNRAIQAAGIPSERAERGTCRPAWWAALCLFSVLVSARAEAGPFIWDQDTDGIDDRIETVHVLGYSYSFVGADTLAAQRIQVMRQGADLAFGVYVVFDHTPTNTDLLTLGGLGMPVLYRYESVPAVRSVGTFAQVQTASQLAGVERVEATPVTYPQVRDGAAAIGVRDATQQVFPTWADFGGADGTNVVVGILDTGVNDAPDGTYPGHESLIGRCVGGASYVNGDSLLDTPRDGSVNPVDRGGSATHAHGTHVAGIVLGSGGASGFAVGVAPGARFVDVKVLTDAGSGTGVADGLDWCIHNRARDWGVPGYTGIQVLNLSLSSPDASDGQDVVSRLADRAAQLGMVVVASMGNAGADHFVPSPAAGNGVIAVGAMDAQRTPRIADDQWAPFTNYGPRVDDGDGNATDELRPDLLAPGTAVLSADGSLTSGGADYQRLSGTSMAAAFVSGAAAALRSAHPELSPAAIAGLLRATGRRDLAGAPAGVTGPDPRWRSPIGYGVVDLAAARLELEQPQRSQVVSLSLASAGGTQVSVELRTQRERGAPWFVIERAADAGGVAQAFAGVDSAAAAGDSSLGGAVNRHAYAWNWPVPANERGVAFWYRAAFVENGTRWTTPARRFISPLGPPAATVELTVVHDAYDHDLSGSLTTSGPGGSFVAPLPATSAAVSSDWVNGESTTGSVAWTFRVDVPAGSAGPPSAAQLWWLTIDDEGYLNHIGRLTDFRVIWHGAGGDVTTVGGPLPLLTVQGESVYASAPSNALGTDPAAAGVSSPRVGPNPVRAGAEVLFSLPGSGPAAVDVFDLEGRRVARVALAVAGDRRSGRWITRDRSGAPLAPGVYLARLGAARAARIVVVRP